MKKNDIGMLLGEIPCLVSDAFYNLMSQTGRCPRFSSVFKIVKENLKMQGIDYKILNERDKFEIETMARDAFDGIKEAEC